MDNTVSLESLWWLTLDHRAVYVFGDLRSFETGILLADLVFFFWSLLRSEVTSFVPRGIIWWSPCHGFFQFNKGVSFARCYSDDLTLSQLHSISGDWILFAIV